MKLNTEATVLSAVALPAVRSIAITLLNPRVFNATCRALSSLSSKPFLQDMLSVTSPKPLSPALHRRTTVRSSNPSNTFLHRGGPVHWRVMPRALHAWAESVIPNVQGRGIPYLETYGIWFFGKCFFVVGPAPQVGQMRSAPLRHRPRSECSLLQVANRLVLN